MDKDLVFKHYVTALHWVGLYLEDESTDGSGLIELDQRVTLGDVWSDAELMAEVRKEFDTAMESLPQGLWEVYNDNEAVGERQFGHDLALTRNGHGAGFWDRGMGILGERLSDWARSLGGANLVGEKGKVYFEEC